MVEHTLWVSSVFANNDYMNPVKCMFVFSYLSKFVSGMYCVGLVVYNPLGLRRLFLDGRLRPIVDKRLEKIMLYDL